MNILFLTYQGDIAGSTNSIAYLASGLAERGHNVYMGCREASLLKRMLEDSKVTIIPMVFKHKLDFPNIKHIARVVKQFDIDVINAQSSKDRYSSVLARWLYRLPTKVVHTRRQVPQSVGGFFQNLIYEKGTDKVVAVSGGVRDALVAKGISYDHIEVIYNGTSEEKYKVIDPVVVKQLQQKFAIQSGDYVIGCVSRKKKQEQLLKAVAMLPFKVKLIFVGIEEGEGYHAWAEQARVKHEVYFEGTVLSAMTLHYYRLFDLKVLPSTMEGLSQSLLESMFLKVPVIATAAAGNIDLIRHGENGLLYEDDDIQALADMIETLYKDRKMAEQLAENALDRCVNDFSITKTINNYERFFENLLTEGKQEENGA